MSLNKTNVEESANEKKIQANITNWQSSEDPLAPLDEIQMDLVYEIGDIVASLYCINNEESNVKAAHAEYSNIPLVCSNHDFIKWLKSVEAEVKYEDLKQYQKYYEFLQNHQLTCQQLYTCSSHTLDSLNELQAKYFNVTEKTNYLHDLSEQLMAHQQILKDKKNSINDKLKYFIYFEKCKENVERSTGNKINSPEFMEELNTIDSAITYTCDNINFKESKVYKLRYENLLASALTKIYFHINNVMTESMKQVVEPQLKDYVLPQSPNTAESVVDSAFALYYGKFQSAATKVKNILSHLETKEEKNDHYKNTLLDCQKVYFSQRLPILSIAVSKALTELKEKHKTDYSVLFRTCSLFTMKVCQDEARCYSYFFNKMSEQLTDYLGSLCQHLYDILRPCLITINHLEVLTELCGLLKSEMLNDNICSNHQFYKYVETVKQLLQDVEERLVFRTNVFFQHDLDGYKPSPGDLAYPEKLEQMENIAIELKELRPDSRSSVVSLESQEVAHINAAQMAHFRSYTGNSPADLHGMWYPTVKRTLVCLSRLYFCLDRNTFQGLAQEALIVCVRTVQNAADMISARKTPIDGKLFQIKHLLIIREQIAPFQVDFTSKELSLDFSNVQKAAIELLNKRSNIFTFGSNNALLEFLLEGTPKVKEYLVDSRKEIDKQLKQTCEAFISHATRMLIRNIYDWIDKAEHILKIIQAEGHEKNELTVVGQDIGKPEIIAGILKHAQKNMKLRIPEIQRSMQLYLANRETEFILFRPVKNNIVNAFMQVGQILDRGGYTTEDKLQIACPSPEQINILICSVSLSSEQDHVRNYEIDGPM